MFLWGSSGCMVSCVDHLQWFPQVSEHHQSREQLNHDHANKIYVIGGWRIRQRMGGG